MEEQPVLFNYWALSLALPSVFFFFFLSTNLLAFGNESLNIFPKFYDYLPEEGLAYNSYFKAFKGF